MGPMITLHDKFDHHPIDFAPESIYRIESQGPRCTLVTCHDGQRFEVLETRELVRQKREEALGHEVDRQRSPRREGLAGLCKAR